MNNTLNRDNCGNIITAHGCECEKEFHENQVDGSGKIVKNTCTSYDSHRPWCETKDKCGFKLKNKWYDYCQIEEDTVFNHAGVYSQTYLLKNFVGLVIFVILFVIIIPYIIIQM